MISILSFEVFMLMSCSHDVEGKEKMISQKGEKNERQKGRERESKFELMEKKESE